MCVVTAGQLYYSTLWVPLSQGVTRWQRAERIYGVLLIRHSS